MPLKDTPTVFLQLTFLFLIFHLSNYLFFPVALVLLAASPFSFELFFRLNSAQIIFSTVREMLHELSLEPRIHLSVRLALDWPWPGLGKPMVHESTAWGSHPAPRSRSLPCPVPSAQGSPPGPSYPCRRPRLRALSPQVQGHQQFGSQLRRSLP